jgi:hypothetical protein
MKLQQVGKLRLTKSVRKRTGKSGINTGDGVTKLQTTESQDKRTGEHGIDTGDGVTSPLTLESVEAILRHDSPEAEELTGTCVGLPVLDFSIKPPFYPFHYSASNWHTASTQRLDNPEYLKADEFKDQPLVRLLRGEIVDTLAKELKNINLTDAAMKKKPIINRSVNGTLKSDDLMPSAMYPRGQLSNNSLPNRIPDNRDRHGKYYFNQLKEAALKSQRASSSSSISGTQDVENNCEANFEAQVVCNHVDPKECENEFIIQLKKLAVPAELYRFDQTNFDKNLFQFELRKGKTVADSAQIPSELPHTGLFLSGCAAGSIYANKSSFVVPDKTLLFLAPCSLLPTSLRKEIVDKVVHCSNPQGARALDYFIQINNEMTGDVSPDSCPSFLTYMNHACQGSGRLNCEVKLWSIYGRLVWAVSTIRKVALNEELCWAYMNEDWPAAKYCNCGSPTCVSLALKLGGKLKKIQGKHPQLQFTFTQ